MGVDLKPQQQGKAEGKRCQRGVVLICKSDGDDSTCVCNVSNNYLFSLALRIVLYT